MEAVRLELVEHAAGSYQFVHDRVQEAAYALIPEESRPAAHLRLGRLLVAQTPSNATKRSSKSSTSSIAGLRSLPRTTSASTSPS